MSENNSYINWQQLDLITDNDRELGLEFLYFFIDNASTYLEELTVQVDHRAEFNKTCHKIKGAAKSVGADGLALIALSGEKMTEGKKTDLQVIIKEIKDELKNIQDNIK